MLKFALQNILFSLKPVFQVTWSLFVRSSVTESLNRHNKDKEHVLLDVYESSTVKIVFDLRMFLESDASWSVSTQMYYL